jgi:hypothetical protein
VKQKEPGDKPIFGLLSGRELFYFLFSIGAISILVFCAWVIWVDSRINTPVPNGRPTAQVLESGVAVAISETRILYYDHYNNPTNPWRIYDSMSGEVTDGSNAVRALDQAGPFLDALTNGFELLGWNGNIVLKAHSTNFGALIFQWKTNNNELHIFKWADFSGGRKTRSAENVIAADNGWISSPYFVGGKSNLFEVTGNRIGPLTFTNPVPTNLSTVACCPFQGGLFLAASDEHTHSTEIFVLSFTNQAIISSNLSVNIPVPFDYMGAQPDPSGKRVVWVFEGEGRFSRWLREKDWVPSFLSRALDHSPDVYYYSSDLRGTKFHLIMAVEHADTEGFAWGMNGDSIWLPDPEKGIKQYQLK